MTFRSRAQHSNILQPLDLRQVSSGETCACLNASYSEGQKDLSVILEGSEMPITACPRRRTSIKVVNTWRQPANRHESAWTCLLGRTLPHHCSHLHLQYLLLFPLCVGPSKHLCCPNPPAPPPHLSLAGVSESHDPWVRAITFIPEISLLGK